MCKKTLPFFFLYWSWHLINRSRKFSVFFPYFIVRLKSQKSNPFVEISFTFLITHIPSPSHFLIDSFFLSMSSATEKEQVKVNRLEGDLAHSDSSTTHNSIVTQDQTPKTEVDNTNDVELGHQLTRTSTIQSVQKKMTDLLDNPIFSGFLLILAGVAIAFQAGKIKVFNAIDLFVHISSLSRLQCDAESIWRKSIFICCIVWGGCSMLSDILCSGCHCWKHTSTKWSCQNCTMVCLDWWYSRCLLCYYQHFDSAKIGCSHCAKVIIPLSLWLKHCYWCILLW